MKNRKLLCLVLAMLMVLSLFPSAALAEAPDGFTAETPAAAEETQADPQATEPTGDEPATDTQTQTDEPAATTQPQTDGEQTSTDGSDSSGDSTPASSYTITYELNDGAWAEGYTAPVTYTTGTELTLPAASDLTKEGVSFGGWYETEDFSGSAVTAVSETDTGDKTFYAKWGYTVTFMDNKDVFATMTGQTSVIFPETNPTSTDYAFAGWYADEDLTIKVDEGTAVTQDTRLYAGWYPGVVRVNDIAYGNAAELLQAFNACTGKIRLDLLADVDLGSSCLTTVEEQAVTLNLNGYSLTSSAAQAIKVTGGDLTINDSGRTDADGNAVTGSVITSGSRALYCYNISGPESAVVINGGRFQATKYAVLADGGCTITIENGEFTNTSVPSTNVYYAAFKVHGLGSVVVNGGTFTGTYALVVDYNQALSNPDGSKDDMVIKPDVTVNGGTYNGTVWHNRGNLVITGGTFNGAVTDANTDEKEGSFSISGGYFTQWVNALCAPGYRVKTLDSGSYQVTDFEHADPVAKIDDKTYQTVQAAIDDAYVGATVKMLMAEKESITIKENWTVTLDMDGYTLSMPSGPVITNNGNLTIIEGDAKYFGLIKTTLLNLSTNDNTDATAVVNNGTLSIGTNVKLSGYIGLKNYGTLTWQGTIETATVGVCAIKGTANIIGGSMCADTTALEIDGGTVTISNFRTDSDNGKGIGIFGGSVTLNSGDIEGTTAGIYVENCESFVLNDGMLFGNAGNGLIVKGGNVTVNGGFIRGKGGYYNPAIPEKPGVYWQTGDAVSVEADFGTYNEETHNITLNINGGTFVSDNAYAVSARFTAATAHDQPVISITGGKFTSAAGKSTVYAGVSEDKNAFDGKISISWGLFSAAFSDTFLAAETAITSNTDTETATNYPYAVHSVNRRAGDCNGDGSVSLSDLLTLKKALAGNTTASINSKDNADVDGNMVVNLKDLLLLKRMLANA